MRLFISAGEPSGDLHGANLIRSLRALLPQVEVDGFGGDRMAAAGCRLLFPLCDLALVGFLPVAASLPQFWRILGLARTFFREHRPDAVVLIDYPGFHWWLARCARAHGIPVLYFVPPQLWAWAGWRTRKMRRLVDRVLCTLPFEEEWFQQRRVPARYVGHPYFDELSRQRLDSAFLEAQQARPGTVVALLPGSRNQELTHNVPSLLRAAALIHDRRPDTRFLVACLRHAHARRVEAQLPPGLPVEVHAGRTPEMIELAHSCIAVSGSVGLELLYRGKPSVVVYRHHWLAIAIAKRIMMRCPYISLVNLLAGKALFPEFLTGRCEAEGMADHVLHWLNDSAAYNALVGELLALRTRVARPGACDRAAADILDTLLVA